MSISTQGGAPAKMNRARTPPRHARRSSPPLEATFATVRGRLLLILGTAAGLWCLAAFLGAIALGVWIDLALHLSPGYRAAAWLLFVAAAAGVAIPLLRRAHTRSRDGELARELDRLAGTGGEIRAGWELDRPATHSPRPELPLTRGLARLASNRAAAAAAAVNVSRTSSAQPFVAAAIGCLAIVLAFFITGVAAPRLTRTEFLRFTDPYGDHPPYSPWVFTVTPEQPLVPYGSDLEITARVAGPAAEQLELVLVPPPDERSSHLDATPPIDVLPLFPRANGEWRVSLANVTAPVDYYVRIRRARSVAHSARVQTVPEIVDVRYEVSPPEYTNLPSRTGPLEAKGLDIPHDTRLKVFIKSNRPLSAGQLAIVGDDARQVELQPGDDPREVSGEFTVTANARLDLNVTDVDGQHAPEGRSFPLRVLVDQQPLVRLTQPRAVSFATPTAVIPVTVAAEDDFGLTRLELFRSLNASRALPDQAELPPRPPRRLEWSTQLPLGAYGLEPGDEIKLFAHTEDNDPRAPQAPLGKWSESSVVTLRIISQEEFDRLHRERVGMQSLTRKYQQVTRRLERLAAAMEQLQQELENQPADSPLAESLREKIAALAAELEKEAEELRKLSENELPLEIDRELNPQLQELAEALREMAEQARHMAGNQELSGEQAREGLRQQREQLDRMRQKHEDETMEPLEWLRATLALKQQEAAFMELVQRQRDLADRLTALKNQSSSDDPAARVKMRDMEEEQRRNRESLTKLLDAIESEALRLPEDERLDPLRETALEFARAVRASEAGTAMRDGELALSEFDGPRGQSEANRAAEILESFIGQCNGMGGECENCLPKFAPGTSLAQALSNTLGALAPKSGVGGVGNGMAGEGGYSSRMSGMDNVGLYGGMPLIEGSGREEGNSSSAADGLAAFGSAGDGADGAPGEGFDVRQSGGALGGADWGVPPRYRRQVGRYLQRLVDELDEQ